MCGALTGAILSINMISGRRAASDSQEENYALVQEVLRRFETTFGSTNCYDLTGCDFTTEEGQLRFLTNNIFERCRHFTEEAARMTMEILEEKGH